MLMVSGAEERAKILFVKYSDHKERSHREMIVWILTRFFMLFSMPENPKGTICSNFPLTTPTVFTLI